MFPTLFRKEIEDPFAQENFKRLMDFFTPMPLMQAGFIFVEVTLPLAVTNYKYPHNLGYQPKDVILMHNSQNVTVTFNYLKFDRDFIDFTTSGATTLRFLLGRVE